MSNLGFMLQMVVQAKGMTQAEVARKLGVSTTTISSFFNGRHELKSNNLLKLLEILEINIVPVIDKKISSILNRTDVGTVGSSLDDLFDEVQNKLKKKNITKMIFNLANEQKIKSPKIVQIQQNLSKLIKIQEGA